MHDEIVTADKYGATLNIKAFSQDFFKITFYNKNYPFLFIVRDRDMNAFCKIALKTWEHTIQSRFFVCDLAISIDIYQTFIFNIY